jgi:hypothetical protein
MPRVAQVRAGQSRSPWSPSSASRTLNATEVEGGTLFVEV